MTILFSLIRLICKLLSSILGNSREKTISSIVAGGLCQCPTQVQASYKYPSKADRVSPSARYTFLSFQRIQFPPYFFQYFRPTYLATTVGITLNKSQ